MKTKASSDTLELMVPLKPELIWVKGGSYKMGAENGESDQQPVNVQVVEDFYIGKYPVTVKQFKYFCEETGYKMPTPPKWGWKDTHPMVNVNFHDAQAYCEWLNILHGGGCRLPSEIEWEYIAKGGCNQEDFIYSGSNDVEEIGYFFPDEDLGSTKDVGTKKPNALGIYDLSGQVWEWCDAWYKPYVHLNNDDDDYSFKVLRGGSWADAECYWQVTWRDFQRPETKINNVGFRVVLA